ncbi:PilN domain-containing protein [Myxococcota bacterium]|nr:PilN domain-containing protein [Myxococcota bacterium]
MLRINLIPQKISPKEARGQQVLFLILLVWLATGGGLFYHYKFVLDTSSIEKNRGIIKENNRKIAEVQAQLSQYKVLPEAEKQKLQAEYQKRVSTVGRIEKVRSNPVFVLLELARIVSVGQLPTVTGPENKTELDTNWDPSPMFFTSLNEKDRFLTLEGVARSHYDVSELARRMRVSAYFRNPEILEAKVMAVGQNAQKKDTPESTMVTFKIKAVMVY